MGRVAGLTAEETRQRVVTAAAEEFAAAGYDGARISSIALRAGLSTGAIYNHYASKAALLGAVVEQFAAGEVGRLLLDDTSPPVGVLDLIVRNGVALQSRDGVAPLLAEAILAGRRDREVAGALHERVSGRERMLADVVRFAQQAGEATDDVDADVVARFCLMLGLGSLLVDALELEPTDATAWSSFITRLVDGFRTDPSPSHDSEGAS